MVPCTSGRLRRSQSCVGVGHAVSEFLHESRINSIMTSRVASTASPPHRPAAHRQLRRHGHPRGAAIACPRVRFGRDHALRAAWQHRISRAGGRPGVRRAQPGQELPGWVGIDQEGGRVARLRSPFTEWPPMAVLGRSDDPEAGARVCAGAGDRDGGRRHLARLRAGARHPHESEESGDRRPRARREAGGRGQARPRDHRRAAARRASRPAESISPVTATPPPIRMSSFRSSSIRQIGCARSSSRRSRRRSRRAWRSS